jgi:hypothetical protein
MHPYLTEQLAAERRSEMLTQAQQCRLARRPIIVARASRRAERAERRMPGAQRTQGPRGSVAPDEHRDAVKAWHRPRMGFALSAGQRESRA